MLMDRITLEREEGHFDWHTNNGSIYTGSHANDTTTCIYIFHTRTDDAPLTQLGEIRSWIRDGQRRVAFIVGNFYNELTNVYHVSGGPGISERCLEIDLAVFAIGLAMGVAELVRENSDKLTITFLTDMPECTRNTIIVGTIGLGVSWPISAEKGFQLKFNNIREQGPPLRMKTHNRRRVRMLQTAMDVVIRIHNFGRGVLAGVVRPLSLNINQSFVNLEKVE
ncbi:hypothetical protein B0H14DRAFT_2570121 [Mycena olivaceomarginata]|nr:hypothetical protein B0H14DRAFT_2570121 [Mycena olivaceomarginata]